MNAPYELLEEEAPLADEPQVRRHDCLLPTKSKPIDSLKKTSYSAAKVIFGHPKLSSQRRTCLSMVRADWQEA
jgi:hypothetical protein